MYYHYGKWKLACPLFRGCPLLGGENVLSLWEVEISLSFVQRLSFFSIFENISQCWQLLYKFKDGISTSISPLFTSSPVVTSGVVVPSFHSTSTCPLFTSSPVVTSGVVSFHRPCCPRIATLFSVCRMPRRG